MVRLTKQDVVKVFDELDRRIKMDVEDGMIPNKARWIDEEREARLQGVYGTIMAIVPNDNWREIVWWMDDVKEERYGKGVCD